MHRSVQRLFCDAAVEVIRRSVTTLLYTVKKGNNFPVLSRDVTNETLSGRELFNYSRPGRVWLVTSRLGTGKSLPFFTVILPDKVGE
jgi:hypothetical protein